VLKPLFTAQKKTAEPKRNCPSCGGRLFVHRTWRRIYLRCRSCSARYPLEAMAGEMDDALEEYLANIPVNRLW